MPSSNGFSPTALDRYARSPRIDGHHLKPSWPSQSVTLQTRGELSARWLEQLK